MIGNRLRQVREEHGLSQQELADKLGKSQNTISSWEKDRTFPKLKNLNQLCDLYGCTYEYLTGTKQHDVKDITMDDILIKIMDFNIVELQILHDNVEMQIERCKQIEAMQHEKEMLQQKLLSYEKEIAKLKSK
ncbi:MAG: helix-turn-helix transcriptional regulator [Treponema sp.]|nr:helix-turn-helix transcriptional regulator [Treponema sp.]